MVLNMAEDIDRSLKDQVAGIQVVVNDMQGERLRYEQELRQLVSEKPAPIKKPGFFSNVFRAVSGPSASEAEWEEYDRRKKVLADKISQCVSAINNGERQIDVQIDTTLGRESDVYKRINMRHRALTTLKTDVEIFKKKTTQALEQVAAFRRESNGNPFEESSEEGRSVRNALADLRDAARVFQKTCNDYAHIEPHVSLSLTIPQMKHAPFEFDLYKNSEYVGLFEITSMEEGDFQLNVLARLLEPVIREIEFRFNKCISDKSREFAFYKRKILLG